MQNENINKQKLTPLLISVENRANTHSNTNENNNANTNNNTNSNSNSNNNTNNSTNTNKTQTETDDRIQTEEDLSKYEEILKNYPKTKTYITQIYLIYPISKKAIEKAINARITIEHHFQDTYQENIIYGINQCFRFNKSRPSPAQVIDMITGDTVAELKHKETDKHKNEKSEVEKYKEAKEKYESLRNEALKQYFGEDRDNQNNNQINQSNALTNKNNILTNNQNNTQNQGQVSNKTKDQISNQNNNNQTNNQNSNNQINTQFNNSIYKPNPIRQRFKSESELHPLMYPTPIHILDEIMTDFISIQAHILSFGVLKLNGCGIGITNHLSKISTKPANQPTRLLDDCFTMYLRSKPYRTQVIKSGIVRTEIPDKFIKYVEDLIVKHEMYERNSKRRGSRIGNKK